MKVALTIAGSDSGGGAGIQADIKAIQAQGVFATSVITAVTAQNTVEVRAAHELPLSLVRTQLEAVLDDIDVAATKTGMLSSAKMVETVCDVLRARKLRNLVVDPVMISKGGHPLLRDDAIDALTRELLPLALVVTPNLHEARRLINKDIASIGDMRDAAARIAGFGPRYVVVKGGHADFALATDVFFDGETATELRPDGEVIAASVHGTGCTFSAAIAARLALGEPPLDAVTNAKRYITDVIRHAPDIGHGHRPGHHFYFLD